MQTKQVIESVLKVSSLIIVLNGFEIVERKFMPHFEGEKGDKGKNPLYFRKVMHCMHLECDLWKICDCLEERNSHKCDTPKEKE
jgi:hypothetical protein